MPGSARLGTVFGMQQPEIELGLGFDREVGKWLPVRQLVPRRDRGRLKRIDAARHVAGQSV
ncbi:MAG: hypothetical protein QOJ62_2734, partial [Actinomycetota bacterium]|nr:hypothetical protein [Actinomycetota bacterium]